MNRYEVAGYLLDAQDYTALKQVQEKFGSGTKLTFDEQYDLSKRMWALLDKAIPVTAEDMP